MKIDPKKSVGELAEENRRRVRSGQKPIWFQLDDGAFFAPWRLGTREDFGSDPARLVGELVEEGRYCESTRIKASEIKPARVVDPFRVEMKRCGFVRIWPERDPDQIPF